MNEKDPGSAGQAPLLADIRITMTMDNKVSVVGTIEDRILFLGVMEIAKETVFEFHRRRAAANGSPIIPFRGTVQ